MLYILLIVLIAMVYLPQWWVKHVIKRYDNQINALPGTGGEFAQHLIERYQLSVSLETTESGDHYDPQSKTVRLSPQFYNGKSLSAIAIAAHEVGHAIQDHRQERLLNLRTDLVKIAQSFEKLGSAIILLSPIVAGISHSPGLGLLIGMIGFLSLLSTVVVHFISLPVEIDASFNKALPLLKEGRYLPNKDLQVVKTVLLAAALTYVAAALAGMLNIWRWLMILRR